MNVTLAFEAQVTRLLSKGPQCIHKAFKELASRTPSATALTFNSQQMSYAELDHQSDCLAKHLASQGAAPEVLVALYLERSFEMVVGILAVLKTGAAYVPIDLSYPKERVSFILKDTAAPIILTVKALASSLPPSEARVLCLDGLELKE